MRFEKAEPKLEVGIYLGTERDSNEYRIAGNFGVMKAITVKRLPLPTSGSKS